MPDKTIQYTSIHRNVKYPRMELKTGKLVLILPHGYREETTLIKRHSGWIQNKMDFIERVMTQSRELNLNANSHVNGFKCSVARLVRNYAGHLGVDVKNIFFRKMRTKWASCSSEGNLTINPILRLLPKKYISYVIFHEVAHRLQKRHNGDFYGILKRKFADPAGLEEKLFAYWFLAHRTEQAKS